MQQKALLYDRAGDEHYNVISAFIKSMQNQRAPDLKRLVLLEPV
jgi:replication-associated recombination protein RarA